MDSHEESFRLRSKAEWLAGENTKLMSSGVYYDMNQEAISIDLLQSKLEGERARRAKLEAELMSAEDHIVSLLGNKEAWSSSVLAVSR